ncbi:MAG: 30S ribosomal protein S9 [Patescibacteria group bacterium]
MPDKKEKKAIKKTVKTVKKSPAKKSTEKEAESTEKKRDYLYAVGKRKTAIAQVRVYKKGDGKIIINKKEYQKFFPTDVLQEIISKPLDLIGQSEKLSVSVKVIGGGQKGQAEAVGNGISKALIQLNPNFRKPLKKAGYLTRDARKKERKKPGLRRARRAPQWSKR